MDRLPTDLRSPRPWLPPAAACVALVVWLAVLCFLPDPRPLSAPEFAVKGVRSLTRLSDPVSRAVASVTLRLVAFGLLGLLTVPALSDVTLRVAVPLGIVLAVALAVLSQWVNYGYFPVVTQLKVSVPSAAVGALVGFALRRSRLAMVGLGAIVVAMYFWGTSTRISDDLDAASRLTVDHVLDHAGEIRDGDEGFADAAFLAFSFAEDNSHRTDPVHANKAAVLALGIIFGDDKVARLAQREIDSAWKDGVGALRQRVTLRGRGDTPRHFWVSAALVLLTDETQATTVGTAKELMDSAPGGSGFSFPDLAANRAGILFALAATRNTKSARETQLRITAGDLQSDDYCPEIADLPEGLTRDRFQAEYGGLAGPRTRELMAIIEERMATRTLLRVGR